MPVHPSTLSLPFTHPLAISPRSTEFATAVAVNIPVATTVIAPVTAAVDIAIRMVLAIEDISASTDLSMATSTATVNKAAVKSAATVVDLFVDVSGVSYAAAVAAAVELPWISFSTRIHVNPVS